MLKNSNLNRHKRNKKGKQMRRFLKKELEGYEEREHCTVVPGTIWGEERNFV